MEDTKHALWSCSELDVVWADQEAWSFKYEIEYMGVKELLSWMIREGKSLELFAFTAWNVWNQRNKFKLNLHGNALDQVVEQSTIMLAQYQANMQVTEMQVSSRSGGNRWWTPTLRFV